MSGLRRVALSFLLGLAAWSAEAGGQTGQAVANLTPPVSVTGGQARGILVGPARDVRAFKGIPFAAPPVGDLRWRPPQPVKPWVGIRECREDGPSCPQPSMRHLNPPGPASEDCLYLNVWTPSQPEKTPMPVMVWIHGGGFTFGSCAVPTYDGANLARRGVIVVSVNYRLGPIGFLCHPLLSRESDKGVSGNYGLLDQVVALQWVRNNISAFGGDPGNVTVVGESAGGVSVGLLMVSPLARGLFHRAIAQSGSVHYLRRRLHGAWGNRESGEDMGRRLAAEWGTGSGDDALAALRRLDPDAMLKSASSPGVLGPGKMPFGPVVDSWVIPDDPVAMFEAGRFHQVPLMTGSNADDGRMFTMGAPWTGPGQLRRFLQGRFGAMAGEAEAIFGDQGRRRPQDAAAHVVTVGAFAYPARFSAQAVQTTGGRAYLYHFTRVPPHLDRLGVGALHGIEIAYVFGNPRQGRWATEADRRLSDTIQSYWVCFARNGDPNDPGLPHWPAYDTATDRHLELGDEIRVGAGLHARECDFFQRLSRMDRGRVDLTDGAAEPPDR